MFQCLRFSPAPFLTTPAFGSGSIAEPGVTEAQTFDWTDVSAVGFDSAGGRDPALLSREHLYPFGVSDIVVSVTPEPSALMLFATGLVRIFGIARRRGLV
jgi:hypothetical protein